MKNAYQRRRVRARVEKRARMMRLDAITLDFARQVIEEETGAPLEIESASASAFAAVATPAASARQAGSDDGAARLIARDDKKNPLISTFEWTSDASQRILRVPAGFMRNKRQERIEELARERAAVTIDLPLVEEGIEIGKQMMAEMIAGYSGPPSAAAPSTQTSGAGSNGNSSGRGYLNEVSPLTARPPAAD